MSRQVPIWLAGIAVASIVVLSAGVAGAQSGGTTSLEVRGELSIGTPTPAPASSLDTHVRNLAATDPAVRLEAARALGELGDAAAVAPLSQTARTDPRPEVRGWALRSLHQLATPEAIATIRAQAGADTDERVRTLATQLLASVEPTAVPTAPAVTATPAPVGATPAPAPAFAQPPVPSASATVVVQQQVPGPQQPQPVIYPQQVSGQPDYMAYRLQQRPGRGLRIAGWISFGVLYGASFMAAIAISGIDGADEGWPLFLPLVGPFIMGGRMIADSEHCEWDYCYEDDSQKGGGVAAIMVGLLEVAGFAMMVAGYVRRARARRQGYAATQPRPERTFAVVPGGPADGPGLSLAATF